MTEDDGIHAFARGSNTFGLGLWRRLPASGNRVFSPASVSTALVMAWAGAKGDTAEQMKAVLGFEGESQDVMSASGRFCTALTGPKRPFVLRIANRIFGEATFQFEAPFLAATQSAYGASVERMNFTGAPEQARASINGWVEAQTEKRITNLIPAGSLTVDTRLVLANAIYFLGNWRTPFEKEATQPAPFHLSVSARKDVPTMHSTAKLRHRRGDGLAALELPYNCEILSMRELPADQLAALRPPYVGWDLSMLVLLPDAIDGLAAMERNLTTEVLDRIVRGLTQKQVAVMLPRFEVNPVDSIAVGSMLRAMGMPLAFDRERADFTGIANPKDPSDRLYISDVFHKAFVKTDEKGTEAAAATAILSMLMAAAPLAPDPPPIEFRADHPFVFLIRDNGSGAILFMGRVVDPSAN